MSSIVNREVLFGCRFFRPRVQHSLRFFRYYNGTGLSSCFEYKAKHEYLSGVLNKRHPSIILNKGSFRYYGRQRDQNQRYLYTTTLLSKLKIRLKWFLIRQNRPYNIDELSAIFSWVVMGNLIWIVIGTTTFVGLLLYIADTGLSDSTMSKRILLDLLNYDTKLLILSNGNMQSRYENGRIILENVTLCNLDEKNENILYDVHVNSLSLTLSFTKWYLGRGLIDTVDIKGLNGKAYLNSSLEEGLSPRLSIGRSRVRNYSFNAVKIQDARIELVLARPDKSLKVSIFSCELNQLRPLWVFYDLLNANHCSGSINESLFNIHERQLRNTFGDGNTSFTAEDYPWKRTARLRVDQLELNGMPKSAKLNWVTSGKVELLVDVTLPSAPVTGNQESSTFSQVIERLFSTDEGLEDKEREPLYTIIDFKVSFQDLQCTMPQELPHDSLGVPLISHEELSKLVRFINSKKFASQSKIEELEDSGSFDPMDLPLDNVGDHYVDTSDHLPVITFRMVRQLDELEGIDPLRVLALSSATQNPNTNKFIDAILREIITSMVSFRKEIHTEMITNFTKRSNFEIFFNNFLISNLIIVGLSALIS
ncbi:Mitochondrial distribution and morphology protein [Komagataella phaffii CBS 7435]|uniref:Mitochondrial distribution and morphology protein 32 n=2 Tax=Komagataella phaffii TaxID=460519 RepID=C4R9A3_KOMPG|nr:Mitochondrial distribution and morphology protein [Komagataella phaffii GS115]AOA64886.1 GQ67_05330T0 [Komagataella phaffii]CAH2450397.1 Mitochondrial distribution and morphology protein [Komagataella phaffii CBS 7435]AOA70059.1 GQ68_05283T0 [Komagataella phaffii GS115]CAY72178.1 Mitochondrial distribution and morphology protein [Komagataella phaffii GS115]SCV12328.1 Mitochondrial distribution and morphology protein [Komagataella phaffii CBS 7435]